MKFLTETVENVQVDIQESSVPGIKDYYITGIFMQSGTKNKNGRVYPPEVLVKEMNRYITEQVKNKRSVGELNHPDGPNINLDKVSHIITELWAEGNNIYGKAKILNTPQGQIVKTLIDEGVQLGVSTRGFGSLKNERGAKVVQNDFRLSTIDIVQDPSCQSAYVSSLMESKEFYVDESGNIKERDVSMIKEEAKEEITEEDFSKWSIEKLQKHWETHKDEERPSPVFANQLKQVSAELAKRKKLNEQALLEKVKWALDEVSKKTLGSYVKKATKDVETRTTNSASYTAAAERHLDNADRSDDLNLRIAANSHRKAADMYYKSSDREAAKVNKRQKGISKAVDKLTEARDGNEEDRDPEYVFRTTHNVVLSSIVKGKADPVHLAKKELAARGLDSDGKWIGFKSAKKHHFDDLKEESNLMEDRRTDARIRRLRSSKAILPASRDLHGKNKSSLDDVSKTWEGRSSVQVLEDGTGHRKFLCGAGHGYNKAGDTIRLYHDQTWKDLGHHKVVNEIHLDNGKIVHKENDEGVNSSYPLYVYK